MSHTPQPTPHNPSREAGFAMLLVFAMAAAVAILLYMELPRVAFEAQRNREQFLIDRGEQYQRAIQLYFRKTRTYPATLEQLESTNNIRFLRRRYKDPMTGKDEWRIIHMGPGGMLTDSLVQKPPGLKPDEKDQEKASASGGMGSTPAAPGQPAAEGPLAATRRRPSELGTSPPMPGQPGEDPNSTPSPAPQYFPSQPDPSVQPGQSYPNPNPQPQPVQPQLYPYPLEQPPVPIQPYPYAQPQAGQPQPYVPLAQPYAYPSPQTQPGQPQPYVPSAQPYPYPYPQTQPGQPQPYVPLAQPYPYPYPQTQPGQPQVLPYLQVQPVQSQPYPFPVAQPTVQPQPYPGTQIFPGQAPTPDPTRGLPGMTGPFGRPGVPQLGVRGGMVGGGVIGGFVQQPYTSSPYGGPPPPSVPYGTAPSARPVPTGGAGSNPALEMIQRILTTPRPGGLGQTQGQSAFTIGGGIAGVATTLEAEGIKVYNERTKYNEWEFVYDFRKDRSMLRPGTPTSPPGLLLQAPQGPTTPMQNMPLMQPSPTQPGTFGRGR